jgi:hypothetical protein
MSAMRSAVTVSLELIRSTTLHDCIACREKTVIDYALLVQSLQEIAGGEHRVVRQTHRFPGRR